MKCVWFTHWNGREFGGLRGLKLLTRIAVDSMPPEDLKVLVKSRVHLVWSWSPDSVCHGHHACHRIRVHRGKLSRRLPPGGIEMEWPRGVTGWWRHRETAVTLVTVLVHELKHLADQRRGRRFFNSLPYGRRPHEHRAMAAECLAMRKILTLPWLFRKLDRLAAIIARHVSEPPPRKL